MPTITEINGDNDDEEQQRNHLAKRSKRLTLDNLMCDSQLDRTEVGNNLIDNERVIFFVDEQKSACVSGLLSYAIERMFV